MPEVIGCVPVASSGILNEPLFINGCTIGNGGVIGNRNITNELQVINAIGWVRGGSGQDDGWQRCGLNDNHVLRWVDDEGGFDELSWCSGWDEGCGGGAGGAG